MREMKNSGIEWIGDIPAAWGVHRIASHFQEVKEKNTDNAYSNALQFKMGKIIAKSKQWDEEETNEIYAAYTVVHPKTIMINGLNLEFDFVTQRVAQVECDGIITSAYIALSPRDDINVKYICYLLKSYDACRAFHNMGRGLRKILSYRELKNKLIVVPPLNEQERIAAFLDSECAAIDTILEKTRASIDEYKKLKQSVITQAVTKGIRGDRPMKDSGIEWIGEIPKEWKSIRLKNLFEFGKGLPITKENLINEGIPVISYGQIHSKQTSGVEIQSHLLRYVDKAYLNSNPQSVVHSGDFIFADTSEDLEGCGNAVFVDKEMSLFAGYHTIILVNKKSMSHKYYAYLFRTDLWRSQIRSKVTGVKLFSISKKILSNTVLIVPTDNEKDQIVDYLDAKCAEIDNLISKKEQYLTEIENYKKSLIYEYVTGKKEVI